MRHVQHEAEIGIHFAVVDGREIVAGLAGKLRLIVGLERCVRQRERNVELGRWISVGMGQPPGGRLSRCPVMRKFHDRAEMPMVWSLNVKQ